MIDFHAHVLPGIDDGARDANEALMLLASQKAQGITTVVATPHYNQEIPFEKFVAARFAATEELNQAAEGSELPQVIPAAEVALFYGLSGLEDLSPLCIENTNYMLVEMPFSHWIGWEYEELYNLLASRGVRPILAHLDRYIFCKEDFANLHHLLELEVLVQLNASAFLSFSNRRMAKQFITHGAFTVLGSDCHHPIERPCRFAEACRVIQKKWGKELLTSVQNNAELILANKSVQRDLWQ